MISRETENTYELIRGIIFFTHVSGVPLDQPMVALQFNRMYDRHV